MIVLDDWPRIVGFGLIVAIAVLAISYHWLATWNHHRGHVCLMNTLEHHDPLLLALVIITLHRRKVYPVRNLPETVAWMVHRHKLYHQTSVLHDDGIDEYLQSSYDELGQQVANRITDRTGLGEWQ